jgi:hypothetical protein
MKASPSQKKVSGREVAAVVIAVSLLLLGVLVVSDQELQERLGQTYKWATLTVAAMAAVFLALHLRARLFGP